MSTLLALRQERLQAGEQPLGWKAGLGTPAAMELLGTEAALIGFLTDRSLLAPGAEVSVDGWTKPLLEPEIALYLDGSGGIAAIGLAIELVDLDPPPQNAQQVLAGNIYHRHVLLGPERAPSADGLTARVFRNDELVAETDDPQELTGDLHAVARLVAETVGDQVRPGDVVIAGSIVPALPLAPGDRLRYELGTLGSLSLSVSASSASA